MILVLVCMFMVSLIGAMVLSATMVNYRMKTTQLQAADNFYDTEAVMEEVTVEVRQAVMEAYRKSYEKLLLNYLDEAVAADRREFFLLYLAEMLELHPTEQSEGVYLAQGSGRLSEIEVKINARLGASGSLSFAESDTIRIDIEKQQLRIQDVELSFTDASGYRTELKTDLVLTVAMPEDSFSTNRVQLNRYFDNYVVISDADVISDSSGTEGAGGTIAYVYGSIYAGNNLRVNAGLNLTGERVILGETLQLPYGSNFSATTGSMEQSGIWARNVELDGGTLDLTGDCYVVDDTTFKEKYSSMTIRNGGYYGYSYSEDTEGDPGLSSAILINKPEITLDFSAANMLWLAGNAYIKEQKLFDDDDVYALPATEGILEGESLAYKNLQSAYLLPGCCMKGVEHNPVMMSETFYKKQGDTLDAAYMISEAGKVTQTDMIAAADMMIGGVSYGKGSVIPAGTLLPIGTILPAQTELPCDVSTPLVEMLLNKKADGSDFVEDEYYIDLSAGRTEVGIELKDYVYLPDPVTVRYSNTKQMAYFYLRFVSPQDASAYFMEFANTTSGARLLKQLQTLGDASIRLPAPENVIAMGNLVEYEYNAGNGTADYGIEAAGTANNLLWREALLTSNYNALLTRLNPGGRLDSKAVPVESSAVSAFDYLINPVVLFEESEDDLDSADGQKLLVQQCTDAQGNPIQFCVAVGRDITTSEISTLHGGPLTNTIVIADGNVVVDTAFSGTVIAKGNVSLKVSGMGERVSEGITGLASLMEHDVIGPYFKEYRKNETTETEEIDYLKMTEMLQLDFDGWVKN